MASDRQPAHFRTQLCAAICVHDDYAYLGQVLKALRPVPCIVVISQRAWAGADGHWEESQEIARAAGARTVVGEFGDETAHRLAARNAALGAGFTHMLVLDSDEVIEPKLLGYVQHIAEHDLADRVYVEWDTYWKSPEYVIRPRERYTPCIMLNLSTTKHKAVREFEGGRPIFLNEDFGIVHHLSYAGSDHRVWRKIHSWSHRDEVVPGWWERVWKAWDSNKLLRDLHPTHPSAYRFAERRAIPEILVELSQRPSRDSSRLDPQSSGKVDIVIPAHGGQGDLDHCLASLQDCLSHIAQIIVVDSGSHPPIKVPASIRCQRLEQNYGFSHACNHGLALCTAKIVLLLNSDTRVPNVAMAKMLETINRGGSIAAVGPLTNNAGHGQQIEPTYTQIEHLNLFAEDFAESAQDDRETDMLVGFCLMARRSAVDEVGGFDERFGIGTFEDNDLCYRLRRAGYRLVVCGRAYVHHEGSRTLRELEREDHTFQVAELLARNERRFRAKWRRDLESGYASHLSGLGHGRIQFDPDREPGRVLSQLKLLAARADISLCMIVRYEERVIRECLESAEPFFREMLVLDTGSTDATPQIATECGAVVRIADWQDSFALARTDSMADAKGKWIMWIDADDTVPLESGVEILRAVASAGEDVVGFVVPVRFLDGTQVDHVKVFRNYTGLRWEGRIHEQILPSLRECARSAGLADGGRLVRLNCHILHSGYDTSPEGQTKKRVRDEKLLRLDLEDRPDHPFVLFNLGMTAHFNGDQPSAETWLRRCLQLSGQSESHVRKAYALLAAALAGQERPKEAMDTLKQGLAAVPGDPEMQFLLAKLIASQDPDGAIELYEAVLRADVSTVFTSLDPGILGYKTRHNLAHVCLTIRDYERARMHWRAALEEGYRSAIALSLFEAALHHVDLPTARDLLQAEAAAEGFSETWAVMAERLSELTGLDPLAHFRAALDADPGSTGVRLVLARHLLNRGLAQASVPHLDYLQRHGIAEGAFFLGVLAQEQGDLLRATGWLERALELNPGHVETAERLAKLGLR